jgi:hypothetical protein
MATIQQVRGMLFEEAVLFLLSRAGYRTIDSPGTDGALRRMGAGLGVRGRGGLHQIDAIADYEVTPPFGYPQRLLVEAKCYGTPVQLPVIRNAVGVLKDVNEYWHPKERNTVQARYHYLQAIFSTSPFSSPAEDYAFAQDVYLFPLSQSRFFRPLIDALAALKPQTFGGTHWSSVPVSLSDLRRDVRADLRDGTSYSSYYLRSANASVHPDPLDAFLRAVHLIGGVVIGMLGRRFPLFLVPAPGVIEQVHGDLFVQVSWDSESWYLRSRNGDRLFSFDLPPRLFTRYAQSGLLTRSGAIDMKREVFADMHAAIVRPEGIQFIRFHLDPEWLGTLLRQVEHRRPGVTADLQDE